MYFDIMLSIYTAAETWWSSIILTDIYSIYSTLAFVDCIFFMGDREDLGLPSSYLYTTSINVL